MLSIRGSSVARALVVVLALAAWLTVAALGGPAQGRLSQVQTNDAAAFLPASAESTRAGEAGRAFVATESLPGLVVRRPADVAELRRLLMAVIAAHPDPADEPTGGVPRA